MNDVRNIEITEGIGAYGNGSLRAVRDASGDDFHIRAYLSSAGTIDISRPVFNMKKL